MIALPGGESLEASVGPVERAPDRRCARDRGRRWAARGARIGVWRWVVVIDRTKQYLVPGPVLRRQQISTILSHRVHAIWQGSASLTCTETDLFLEEEPRRSKSMHQSVSSPGRARATGKCAQQSSGLRLRRSDRSRANVHASALRAVDCDAAGIPLGRRRA